MSNKNKKSTGNGATLRRIIGYAKPCLPLVAAAVVLVTTYAVLSHIVPKYVGNAIDLMIGEGRVDADGVAAILPKIAAVTILGAICTRLASLIGTRVSTSVVRRIREDCVRKIQRLPLSYLDSTPSGDIVSRVISDTDQLSEGLLTGIIHFFSGSVTIVIALAFMMHINFAIAAVVAVLTPFSMLLTTFIAKRSYSLFRARNEISARQTALMDEAISGREVIEAYSHEGSTFGEFERVNDEYVNTATKAVFFSSLPNPSSRFLNSLIYSIVALIGALTAISGGGAVTAGQLTALLTYAREYAKPFNDLSGVVAEFQGALASAARVFEFLDAPELAPDPVDAEQLSADDNDGSIRAKNVDFSYTDAPFMKNMTFEAKAGQKIAVVGPTGCGKTTLINLFMRFYEIDGGTIEVGGHDISRVTRSSLRASLGMVLQDTWISSGTVRDNIAMAKPEATDEEIEKAARAARAHSFISKLPQGYDTVLGEGGGRLSRGQIQLICIARVMLALPPMLILDEATSSIDTRTEIKIQEAFAEMMRGRTSVIVAHRLNTIKNADRILVMKDGNIVEQGTHCELMEADGFYASLYGAQFRSASQGE